MRFDLEARGRNQVPGGSTTDSQLVCRMFQLRRLAQFSQPALNLRGELCVVRP